MKKLGRFTLLAFFYVLLFICFYAVVPFIAWVFGGNFRDVAQCVPYALMATIVISIGLGIIFNECFDQDFLTKD